METEKMISELWIRKTLNILYLPIRLIKYLFLKLIVGIMAIFIIVSTLIMMIPMMIKDWRYFKLAIQKRRLKLNEQRS
jgi:hypothetical protein